MGTQIPNFICPVGVIPVDPNPSYPTNSYPSMLATDFAGKRLSQRIEKATSGYAEMSAAVVERECARPCAGQHQKTAGDGEVLHEIDHLHLVFGVPMEEQGSEHAEAGDSDCHGAGEQAEQHA